MSLFTTIQAKALFYAAFPFFACKFPLLFKCGLGMGSGLWDAEVSEVFEVVDSVSEF